MKYFLSLILYHTAPIWIHATEIGAGDYVTAVAGFPPELGCFGINPFKILKSCIDAIFDCTHLVMAY